jgi:hypothetical protein
MPRKLKSQPRKPQPRRNRHEIYTVSIFPYMSSGMAEHFSSVIVVACGKPKLCVMSIEGQFYAF